MVYTNPLESVQQKTYNVCPQNVIYLRFCPLCKDPREKVHQCNSYPLSMSSLKENFDFVVYR